MKMIILRVLALVLLSAAIITTGRWYFHGRYLESTDDAYVEGDITNLSPKVSAHVVDVTVADNQRVKAGDVLIRLDDKDYRAKAAKAAAWVS